ncbi:ABC transporter ATP-binding protein [Pelistega suis]|uniref:ATP-binding cassette domain-containing protein n=1 Tax=Pelistega suis TaxID=1631957 RepID=A0A849NZN5_9BURK|nr:oligopeptide/dipeptide ABC transporter ATP-binding protein [Pelistega suis]NOL50610.1 ATP-binding cassette domain-containing protein [Pelistega suis]
MSEIVLDVRDLTKRFTIEKDFLGRTKKELVAVDNVSFSIKRQEILGLVGESGSGKTTVGRSVLRLVEPTSGYVGFKGQDILPLNKSQLRRLRQKMQLVFQDPYASLNPRHTVETILSAPLEIHQLASSREEKRRKIEEMLELVGLRPDQMNRYAHEFSGGQRQRVGIARALMCQPELLVADEPVSALDVSIQAQIVNLLLELKNKLGISILFIAHDLSVVGHMSDRIAVMYLGRMMEIAPTKELFTNPQHPYTEALLSAVPVPDTKKTKQGRIVLQGDIPSPINPPSGCAFRNRCRYAVDACAKQKPELTEVSPGHWKACIRHDLQLRPADL